MNLKTHTVYPEIMISPGLPFDYTAKLIDINGKVVEEFKGHGNSRRNAIDNAWKQFEMVADKYKLEEVK